MPAPVSHQHPKHQAHRGDLLLGKVFRPQSVHALMAVPVPCLYPAVGHSTGSDTMLARVPLQEQCRSPRVLLLPPALSHTPQP